MEHMSLCHPTSTRIQEEPAEPVFLLVMVHCGSYVRPTDDVDWAMLAAVSKRAMKEGPSGVSRAAKDKHIIDCSCEFAAISGKHRDVRVWSMKHVDNQIVV